MMGVLAVGGRLKGGWVSKGSSSDARAQGGLMGSLLVGSLFVGSLGVLGGCGGEAPIAESAAFEPAVIHGEPGRFPGQFDYPRGVDAWGDRLVVVDKSARIQILDAASGDAIAWWRTPESDLGKPTGLTVAVHPFDPERRALWVADTHYHRVLVYELPEIEYDPAKRAVALEPEPVFQFGAFGREAGGFIYPTDVAVLLRTNPVDGPLGHIERVYVSEYGGNDRVTAFEPDGEGLSPVFEFGELGSGVGAVGSRESVEFQRPQSVVIDPVGHNGGPSLIVADACNHRLGFFTLDGALIGWRGGPSDAGLTEAGKFTYPYSLEILEDRSMLVCEFGGARVQRVLIDSGEVLGIWGRAGREAGEFNQPWGIAATDGLAFVLDSRNHRVQGFEIPVPAMAGDVRADTRIGMGVGE